MEHCRHQYVPLFEQRSCTQGQQCHACCMQAALDGSCKSSAQIHLTRQDTNSSLQGSSAPASLHRSVHASSSQRDPSCLAGSQPSIPEFQAWPDQEHLLLLKVLHACFCVHCRLKDVMETALLLPAGVAATVAVGKGSVLLASALVSDDMQGSLLGAAVIEFNGSGLQDILIF